MGALQTFHWGALYPDMMDLIAPFCGSAKCSRHNFVFLERRQGGTDRRRGLEGRLVHRQAGAWPASRELSRLCRLGILSGFLPEKLDMETLGYSSLEDFLVAFWEGFFLPKDANNLLTMLLDLAERRHQRQRYLQRNFKSGPRRD